MTEVQLGPLVLSAPRFAAAVGITAFIGVALWQGRRLGDWATNSLLLIVVGARLGFVVEHLAIYREAPLTALYLWQGGFRPLWGLLLALAYTLWARVGRRALPAAAAGLCAWGLASALVPAEPPELTLAGLALPALVGEPVALDSGPQVLHLWASWCTACRRGLPTLVAAVEASAVPIRFVNQGESVQAVAEVAVAFGLPPEQVLLDRQGELGARARALGLPTTLFIAADGTLLHRHVGELSRAELARQLARLSP